MKNPKNKGGDFERWCSRQLSLWWTNGGRDDCIWRTSGSGATHTSRNKKGKKTAGQAGDLCAQDEIMLPFFNNFLVECKSGYASQRDPSRSIGVLYCIDRMRRATESPLLIKWFVKAMGECSAAGRHDVLLIFKRTGRQSCIVMQVNLMRQLGDYAGRYEWDHLTLTYYQDKEVGKVDEIPIWKTIGTERIPIRLAILPLELFFDWCMPDHIIKFLRDRNRKMVRRGLIR